MRREGGLQPAETEDTCVALEQQADRTRRKRQKGPETRDGTEYSTIKS